MIISSQKYREIIKASTIADAFGYQVEFDSLDSIEGKYGENGIDNFKNDVIEDLFSQQLLIYTKKRKLNI